MGDRATIQKLIDQNVVQEQNEKIIGVSKRREKLYMCNVGQKTLSPVPGISHHSAKEVVLRKGAEGDEKELELNNSFEKECPGILHNLLSSEPGRTSLVNSQDSEGFTPLHVAAARGRISAAKVLLTNCASLFQRDSYLQVGPCHNHAQ